MNKLHKSTPSELELQSYLDNELPADKREQVFLWLTNNPKTLRSLLDQRAQDNQLRSTMLKPNAPHKPYHDKLMQDVDDIARGNKRVAWILLGFIGGVLITTFVIFLFINW
ncbi:anti-sigma factor family protein [Hyphococcus lacteus]|uniref:Anti-sigma factor n=1 Tax=Hyphococcus lacteus TaxID=3143536 RepID=A0ABV3Z3M0_9PROT